MKKSSAAASGIGISIAAAMLLAACGGGGGSAGGSQGGSASVGGTVSGVPGGTALLLVNKGADIIAANGSGNFTFDAKVQAGGQYNITLFTQPSGYNCAIANAQGMVDQNADAVTNIAVTCQSAPVTLPMYNVGVTVTGLAAGNSVTLLLYGSDPLTVSGSGLAVFSQALSTSQSLPPWPAITVGTSPAGQTCTVEANPGTRTDITNFVDVGVACQ